MNCKKIMTGFQNKVFIMICFMWLCMISVSHAQSEEKVMERYQSILTSFDQSDWKGVDKKSVALIKSIKNDNHQEIMSSVYYIHIQAIAGLMNEGQLDKKTALQKAKAYEEKTLIIPGHPFKDKCFNCLYPTEEDKSKLFCTSANESGTQIFALEYYHLKEPLNQRQMDENSGKVMKIRAKLKKISVEDDMLPRFKLIFDQVEYYFMNEDSKDDKKLTEIPFQDSLNTYLNHDIFVNSNGTIFKKFYEFADNKGSKVQASFYDDTDVVKKKLVLKSVLRKDSFDFSSIDFPDDAMLKEGEMGAESAELIVIKPMQIIQHSDFKGYVVGHKSKKGKTKNTTFNVILYKQGRLCTIMYFIADILGNDISTEKEQKHFFDFIDKIEIKTNDQINVESPDK